MGLFDFLKRNERKEVINNSNVPSKEENPYENLLWSIRGLCDQFKKENKLGFIGNKIVIRKSPNQYDVDCLLIMANHQCMSMEYTLELSARQYIPAKIGMLLEAHGEAVIEQSQW